MEQQDAFVPKKPVSLEALVNEDTSDLTSLSEKDKAWQFGTAGVAGDPLEPEPLDDLFEVTAEDINGESDKPAKKPRFRLAKRKSVNPLIITRGVRNK